jgi:hypothetical protein
MSRCPQRVCRDWSTRSEAAKLIWVCWRAGGYQGAKDDSNETAPIALAVRMETKLLRRSEPYNPFHANRFSGSNRGHCSLILASSADLNDGPVRLPIEQIETLERGRRLQTPG